MSLVGQRQHDIPWCTVLLVVLAIACHTIVLLGNHKTAASLAAIGASTQGWSGIGLELSSSLHGELDQLMANLTKGLTTCINLTLSVQALLDSSLAQAGSAAEALLESNVTKAAVLLQDHVDSGLSTADAAQATLDVAVDHMADELTQQVIDALHGLMDQLKPAFLLVGQFITKFGDKIQSVIEGFSITLDRVQKLFDQVMAQLSSEGQNQEDIEYNTFTLYDVSGTGLVGSEDLQNMARLYGITALKGTKPDALIPKYDQNGDGQLDKEEYHRFVGDPSMPKVMSVVLRTYSKRLAETAGHVAAARLRDEVAWAVTQYLLLVCAKNLTKVGWVSDALSNGSLPLQFTGDVMVQLSKAVDDPDNTLTTVDTGALVIATMLELHPANTLKAYHLLSNETYWLSEGYDPVDQGATVKRVGAWMQKGTPNSSALLEAWNATGAVTANETAMLQLMPEAVENLQKKKMKAAVDLRRAKHDSVYDQLFASKTAQTLQLHLLGGSAAAAPSGGVASRSVNQGVPARPETLLFAQYLSWNASDTAKRFQKMCFDYSGESSNAVDSFATQISSMVNKVKGFINMLEKYSTPAGIQLMQEQMDAFVEHAAKDMKSALKKQVDASLIEVRATCNSSMGSDSERTGPNTVDPQDPKDPPHVPIARFCRKQVLTQLLGTEIHQMSGQELQVHMTEQTTQAVFEALAQASTRVNSLLDQLPYSRIETIAQRYKPKSNRKIVVPAPSANHTSKDATEIRLAEMAGDLYFREDTPAGVWDEMSSLLQSLSTIIPQATATLKLARREVSQLSSTLDSLFSVFAEKGPPIFVQTAGLWKLMWTLYFCFMVPLNLVLLVYAFWAGGFCGGPGNLIHEEKDEEPPEEEKTHFWRLKTCCCSCCTCFNHCCHGLHDRQLCFWSIIILLQLVCLIIFFVSIALCIFAGVKVFLAKSCAQVYVLGDATICGQTMLHLRKFLETFLDPTPAEDLSDVCSSEQLLTCKMISSQMKKSGVMTTIFSFLAALVSSQLLIESSILHTRAVWRQKLALRDAMDAAES